jgi:quercetin dioxygenase-like cupin family protein
MTTGSGPANPTRGSRPIARNAPSTRPASTIRKKNNPASRAEGEHRASHPKSACHTELCPNAPSICEIRPPISEFDPNGHWTEVDFSNSLYGKTANQKNPETKIQFLKSNLQTGLSCQNAGKSQKIRAGSYGEFRFNATRRKADDEGPRHRVRNRAGRRGICHRTAACHQAHRPSQHRLSSGLYHLTVIVEIAPGACSGRHTHPGIDSGYVIQGDFVFKIDGKPEQTLKAGDSYETSPQTPHDACSVSGNKLIDTFAIEKGKPLTSPAP